MVSLKRFLEKKYGIQIPDAEATPGGVRQREQHRGAGRAHPVGGAA